jgi:hypothetical protein
MMPFREFLFCEACFDDDKTIQSVLDYRRTLSTLPSSTLTAEFVFSLQEMIFTPVAISIPTCEREPWSPVQAIKEEEMEELRAFFENSHGSPMYI